MTTTRPDLPVDPALVEQAAALSEAEATSRHDELAATIQRANRLYYQEDAPELSDAPQVVIQDLAHETFLSHRELPQLMDQIACGTVEIAWI